MMIYLALAAPYWPCRKRVRGGLDRQRQPLARELANGA